jgi:large subunit ribosomal protein L6e
MVKWYQTEDVPQHVKKVNGPTRLRGNIQPGQIVILLSGRHAGQRVVFLKQLESGQLLVTGPYKVNGVPLKRVPQAYTMKTSTTVDVSGVDTGSVTDAYFVRAKKRPSKSETAFFTKEHQKEAVTE